MKSFKRMVIVSSTLLCGLLMAANYAEKISASSSTTMVKKTPAEQVDVLEPGYTGLLTSIQLTLFY